MAGLQFHIDDSYAIPWATQRGEYYDIYGTPDAWFDGIEHRAGSTFGMSYETEYAACAVVPTDVTIELSGDQIEGPLFEIVVRVCLEAGSVSSRTMQIHVAQLLDHYPVGAAYWRNCVMQGETLSDIELAPGQCYELTTTFTFDDASWANPDDMRLAAWAQEPADSGPAEVYQAAILHWPFNTLTMRLLDGAPEFIPPDTPTDIILKIVNAGEDYVPGTATLHYRYDNGDFLPSLLEELDGNLYMATLPAPSCSATPEYYFTALGDQGTTVYYPRRAPEVLHTATVAHVTTLLEDDFTLDQGWTVENDASLTAGAWERVIPSTDGSYGEPTADFDGSEYCFVTQNTFHGDVDNGPTCLVSPTLDLSGTNDPLLRYAIWFACDDQAPPAQDFLLVEISNDDGASWVEVEKAAAFEGWIRREIHVADHLTPTQTTKIRFVAADNPNNSKTEAAVDAVWLFDLSCAPDLCPGDLSCDGVVDFDDIDPFVAALGCSGGAPNCWDPACPWLNGDCNGDGEVTFDDIDPFVGLIGSACD